MQFTVAGCGWGLSQLSEGERLGTPYTVPISDIKSVGETILIVTLIISMDAFL